MSARFAFRAYTKGGALETGEIDAPDAASARRRLTEQGLIPVSVGHGSPQIRWWQREVSFRSKQLSAADLARFSDTLAALLGAGLPLVDALKLAGASELRRDVKAALEKTGANLASGQSLGEATRVAERVFPKEFLDYLIIGDAANALSPVLIEARDLFRARAAMSARLRAALVYPAILVVASLTLFAVLTFFLAPALQPMFRSAGQEPEGILAILFAVNTMVRSDWPILLAAATLALAGLAMFIRSRPGANTLNAFGLRMPILGRMMKLTPLLRATRSLRLLLVAGTPLQTALAQVANRTSGTLRKVLDDAVDAAEQGRPIDRAFSSASVPPAYQQMIRVADQANKWPDALATAGDLLERDVRMLEERLTALATPVITLIAGLGMGIVMMSMVTALLDINQILLPQ